MRGVIYRAEDASCSVSFPIMFVLDKKYVLIGPEFKKGVQACIPYSEYLDMRDRFTGGKCGEGTRCLDMWDALKDNFYFFDVDEPLKFVMYMYFWVAEQTKNLSMIPAPILGLLTLRNEAKISQIYISKIIGIDLSKVDLSQSRDVYFSTLAYPTNPCRIVTERDFSAACLVNKYVPNMIYQVGLVNFKKTLVAFVNTVERLAKEYGFLHGKTHIGHVNQDGTLIDFGEAFGLRELTLLKAYMKKIMPPEMYAKAVKKAEVQVVDVSAACTLLEIYRFIDSIHNYDKHEFSTYYSQIAKMKKWIIDTLDGYFDADESIFTYMARDNIVFDGGYEPKFGLPPSYAPIKENFPTYYFTAMFLA